MNNEKNAYSTFRSKIMQRGDRIDRVENPIVPGMPDVSVCLRSAREDGKIVGKEFWLEMKAPEEPMRPTTPLFGSAHPVLQSQANWFQSQIQAGGHAFFYIDTDKRRLLIPGKFCDVINSLTVTELENIASWKSIKTSSESDWMNLRHFFKELD